MEKLKNLCKLYVEKVSKLTDLSLLLFRLMLGYGFLFPGLKKLENLEGTVQWFESLGYPVPFLNAVMAGTTEVVGAILLVVGLATRFISPALMFVMVVAITTVHLKNGFSADDGGYEIPLYYFIMLFGLMAHGGGRFSLDAIIRRKN